MGQTNWKTKTVKLQIKTLYAVLQIKLDLDKGMQIKLYLEENVQLYKHTLEERAEINALCIYIKKLQKPQYNLRK